MDITSALTGFTLAATLLSITPGIDTALVLRTAAVEDVRRALFVGLGVVTGVLGWGLMAAVGLGAVLAVSEVAYRVLQYAGAAYLVWLGLQMWRSALRSPHARIESAAVGHTSPGAAQRPGRDTRWYARGLMTNLLNPKVGMFYIGFLPQFMPAQVNVIAFSALLAGIHAVISLLWFVLLVFATRPFARALQRPATSRALDAVTGTVLIAFGLRLTQGPA